MSAGVTGEAALVIETRGLSKSYGEVQAVRGVELRVRAGEIYGFLGRNGAGKTTTIRLLLGLVRPDAGSISIFGSSLAEERRAILSRVGFFVESAAAYPNLTVRENLEIQRRLSASPTAAVGEVIDLLKLGEYAGRRAGRLSLGNKQRLSIARALLNKPRLLILDEPVNGLDPAGIVEIRSLLRRLAREEGVTIFMSSHLLDEVSQLADRIGIIHEGRLVEESDAGGLLAGQGGAIEVEVDDPGRAVALLRTELGLARIESSAGGLLRIADVGAEASEVARILVAAGLSLRRLVATREDLEAHFMRLTGGGA
jgi:ABC-2 type transport system ATP-binding protein